MPNMTLEQIAVSDHDCPAAHQPFTGYTIAQVADTCEAQPGHGCTDGAGQPLPFFHGDRIASLRLPDLCLYPHCKCAGCDLCPEVTRAGR